MQLFKNYIGGTGVRGHTTDFLLYVGQIRIWCILLCVTILAQYVLSSCGVDVAYWRPSDWTRLQWALQLAHVVRESILP